MQALNVVNFTQTENNNDFSGTRKKVLAKIEKILVFHFFFVSLHSLLFLQQQQKTNYITINQQKPKVMTPLFTPLLFVLGFKEIVFIALIILLLFGGKKIPELMKGIGKGVKSFKDGMNEINNPDPTKDTSAEKEEK